MGLGEAWIVHLSMISVPTGAPTTWFRTSIWGSTAKNNNIMGGKVKATTTTTKLTVNREFKVLADRRWNIILGYTQILSHILSGNFSNFQNLSIDMCSKNVFPIGIQQANKRLFLRLIRFFLPFNSGCRMASSWANKFGRSTLCHTDVFGAMLVRNLWWNDNF